MLGFFFYYYYFFYEPHVWLSEPSLLFLLKNLYHGNVFKERFSLYKWQVTLINTKKYSFSIRFAQLFSVGNFFVFYITVTGYNVDVCQCKRTISNLYWLSSKFMYCWTVIWHKYNLLSSEDFLRMLLDRQDKLDDISSDFSNQRQPPDVFCKKCF